MSELIRFRLMRAPQKQAIVDDSHVLIEHFFVVATTGYGVNPLQTPLANLLTDSSAYAVGFSDSGITVLGKPAKLVTHIVNLEKWLTEVENSPSVEKLSLKLNDLCQAIDSSTPTDHHNKELGKHAQSFIQLEGKNWWSDRLNVGFSLMVAMLRDSEPTRALYMNRLMLVFGLVELAAENPERFKKAEDIHWALRLRTVILPQVFVEYLRSQRSASLLARRPGFADLYIVRNEWARYEAGEIAHIENVMASETRERNLTSTTETEQTTTTSEQRRSFNEQDSQTTDRFNLHNETSRDSSLNIKADASVDVSAQYGTAKINAHLGGSLDYSLKESQKKATDTAHESVSRSVTRVEEQVTQTRTLRSLSRIVEENKHAFQNNAPGAAHVSGIYRWVNKIERVQIFRYPNRFLLEFQVPEPGAWLRFQLGKKQPKTVSETPLPLTVDGKEDGALLKFTDIGETNYADIAARYKTLGITQPPQNKVISIGVSKPSPEDPTADKEPIKFLMDKTLTVPDGYEATTWDAVVESWQNNNINKNDQLQLWLGVGYGALGFSEVGQWGAMGAVQNGTVGAITEGSVPISIMTNGAYGFNININLTCLPQKKTMDAWKVDTYEKIAQAYYAMKRQHDDELASLSIRSGVQIEGLSPEQNAEMARLEIKKSIIEMLTVTNYAQHFEGRNAMNRLDAANKPIPPQVDLQKASQTASEIQFIEQAFEWENMTYVLYPYFWTGKDQWDQLVDLSGPDPDFARFLRAGSARAVLPARPGFELQAQLYVDTGILWGGGPAPAPGEDDYLSIAEEIRAQEKPPRDGLPGESWEINLPTTLIWLDTQSNSLPVENPHITLDPPPGQILP